MNDKSFQYTYQMNELKKVVELIENNDLKKATEIVAMILGSGIYFPETYISGLILRSKLLIRHDKNYLTRLEIALEAETLSAVEENPSLLIDSKLAIIFCFIFQNKLEVFPDKFKEVEKLIKEWDGPKESKELKLSAFTTTKQIYNEKLKD